jgi:hypothetical protein
MCNVYRCRHFKKFYWRYRKVLGSTSCERPFLNASVVVLFVMFSGNLFQSFIVLQKNENL